MLNTKQMIDDLKGVERTKDEFLKLIDDLIMNENAQIEFFRDQLTDRTKCLDERRNTAQVEHDVRVGYCTQRITLFESMKDRMAGKDVVLMLPRNPLFPAEEPKTLLFGRKRK